MINRINSLATAALAVACFAGTALLGATALAPQSLAQSKVQERMVDGKVVGKAEAAMPGAVVYLKDSKSLNIRTYICDDAGHFHFGQLSQNTDYELWADSNGVKSNTRSISSFDDRNQYYFTLTIK